jgi:hypothetical protein
MARNGVKSGGRQKGSLNKKTVAQLSRAEKVLEIIEAKYLATDIKKLTSNQRVLLFADMLEYTAPKLSRVDNNISGVISIPPVFSEKQLNVILPKLNGIPKTT